MTQSCWMPRLDSRGISASTHETSTPGLINILQRIFGPIYEQPVYHSTNSPPCRSLDGSFFVPVHPCNTSQEVLGALELPTLLVTNPNATQIRKISILPSASRTNYTVVNDRPIGIKGGTNWVFPYSFEPNKTKIGRVIQFGFQNSQFISSIDSLYRYTPMVFFEAYKVQEDETEKGFIVRDLHPLTEDYYLPGFSTLKIAPELIKNLGITLLEFLEKYYCPLVGEAMAETLIRYGLTSINPSPQNFLFLLNPTTLTPEKAVFRDLGDFFPLAQIREAMNEIAPLNEITKLTSPPHLPFLHLCSYFPFGETTFITGQEKIPLSLDLKSHFAILLINAFMRKVATLLEDDFIITEILEKVTSYSTPFPQSKINPENMYWPQEIHAIQEELEETRNFIIEQACMCMCHAKEVLTDTGHYEWIMLDSLNQYFISPRGKASLQAYYQKHLKNVV